MNPTDETMLTRKGYYALVEVLRRPQPQLGEAQCSLLFEYTENKAVKAMAMVPESMVTREWPMEVYLEFNRNYPEALDHVSDVKRMTEVLLHAKT